MVVRTKIDQYPIEDSEKEYLQKLVAEGEIDCWEAVSAKEDTNVDQVT